MNSIPTYDCDLFARPKALLRERHKVTKRISPALTASAVRICIILHGVFGFQFSIFGLLFLFPAFLRPLSSRRAQAIYQQPTGRQFTSKQAKLSPRSQHLSASGLGRKERDTALHDGKEEYGLDFAGVLGVWSWSWHDWF